MKKLLRLFMLAVLFLPLALNAQLSAIYQFSTGIDNTQWYTLTSDSTVLKVGSDNDSYASPVTNIGFTFNFAGVDYTQFSANSDGTVRLGGTAVGTGSYTNPFSSSSANTNAPKICGLGCDGYLVAATADSPADYIAYQLFGSEGDHVLVIEISTGTYSSSTRNNHYTFQIQLAEANNSVTLMYSPIAPAAGPAVTYQIGACTGASDIVLFNVANNTMSTYTAGTTTTNASGTWPDAGRYYTITPNPNACYPVSGLTATNITTTGTTLTWADTNNTGATYSVYNGETLLASGISGNTYDITGLAANTSYVFNVVASCSGDNESNAANVSIRTACGLTSLPWTCSFEESEIVNTTQATALPWCTQRYVSAGTSGTSYPYSYNSTTYSHTGSRCLYFYGTTSSSYPDTMAIILPEIDVTNYPMSNSRITFWARMGAASNTKNAYIGSMTDPNDISTFTVIDNVTVSGTTQTKFSVPLANATGSYIVIMVPKGTGSLYMDDVTIEELPSCLEVTNLTVAGTASNSVTLNWVDAANVGASYTIYNMADNSVVGNTSATTYTVDNLTPNTSYTFGVETNCTSGDAPIITVTATTDCASETMPWSENFDSWTSKSACWSFLSGAFSGTPTTSSSAWTLNTSYGNYINITGKALTMNVYSTNRYWAVTPPISITEDNAMLSVDVAVAGWSAETTNYDADDTLAFAITTDGGATYTTLLVYDNTQLNSLGNDYTTIYIPVNGYNGQTARFAIFAGSSASGGDNRIAIDNVTVSESSSCMPVTNLTATDVTAFGATLAWQGDAAGYTIYNMADTSVLQTTTDTSVVISTLNPGTPYTLGVQANCGSDQSVIVNVSFTTLVTCPAPTNLAVSLTPGNGTIASLSWTEVGTAQAWQLCLNGDTNNLIDITTNPYDLTGLTPEQAYTAQVRSYCDVNDQSEWSNLVNFTPTDAYTLTVNDGTSTNSYVPIYGLWVDDITKSQFIIPASDLTAMQFGNINKLTFYASNANVNWGAAEFNVYVTETTGTTVSDLADYSGMTQVYAGTLSIANNIMEVTFTTPYLYMGGNLMIGFLQTVSGTYSGCNWYGVSATGASMGGYGTSISQRNFLPKTTIAYAPGTQPTCMPVSNLAASDITENAVTLTWSDDNNAGATYTIYNMADSSVVATGVTTMSYDVTGLTSSTNYMLGVVADCSPTSSSNIVVVSFNTPCSTVSLPYTETFESTSGTRNCWDLVSMNTANAVGTSNGMGFKTVNGHEVLRFSSYSSATDYNQYGFAPLMNVSGTATYLRADVTYATYGTNDFLYFGYVTPTDTVWDATAYQTASNSSANTWETATLIIPANATQFAIHYYGNYAYYAWIDTVVVNEMTGVFCFPVTNLSVDNTTETTATISWEGTAASYDIYKDGVFVANVTTDTYTFTGLTAATAYTFGVQALCSATDSADMVTIEASTDCPDVTTLPYYEGFENGLGCWTTLSGSTDGNPWNAQAAFSSGAIAPHTGSGMAASWSWNNSAMHANAWLISPKFVLPNTTEPITFTWWERTNASYPDRYSVVLSTTTNDTVAFTTVVRPYDTAAGSWAMQTVDLSAYAGQSIYIAFHHVDYDKNYLLVDDIALFQGGYVPPAPDTLTVTFAVNNPTMGTTTPAPGTYQYITGDTVHFSATPNAGYSFVGWEFTVGTESDTLGPQYIAAYVPANALMSYGAITFTALFEAGGAPVVDTLTVTVTINDATMGTITPTPGNYYLTLGDTIVFTATPNPGANFDGWRMIVGGQAIATLPVNPYSMVVNANILSLGSLTVMAMFSDSTSAPDSMTIIVNTADPTMGTTDPAPGIHNYAVGEQSIITALPNPGYEFLYWVESATIAGMTMTDTIYNATVGLVVPPVYAGVTLNITAYFQVSQGEPCDAPTGVTVSAFDDQSISLVWDDNTNAESWNIRYRSQNSDWTNVVANTNNYTITGLTPNTTYQMQVQTNCGDGNLSQWSATITQTTTGLNSYLENNISLYPNPANDYIDVRVDELNVTNMEVYDVYGKLINTVNVIDNPTRINVSGLATGMYFVRVTTEQGVATKSFIKK